MNAPAPRTGVRPPGCRRGFLLAHLLGLILATLAPRAAADLDPAAAEASFDAAARLYEQGRFADAAAAYQGLLTNGVVTPAVLFNQGNAWLKDGRLGRAIAAYRQARQLAPRDRDLLANLDKARSKVAADAATRETLATRAVAWCTPNEWAAAALAASWLCGLLFIVRDAWPRLRPPTRTLASLLALTAAGLLALGWMAGRRQTRESAVVSEEAQARYGPLKEAQAAFTLPDGAEVWVTDRKEPWIEIRDARGRTGWVEATRLIGLERQKN